MSTTEFTTEELHDLESEVTVPLYVLFPLGVVGLCALAFRWPTDTVPAYVCWTAYTTFIFFCYTSCFHETAHQTLNRSPLFSLLVGRALGTLIFTPYSVYRESHIRHHAYLNKPTDFELWPYSDPKSPLWFRRVFVWFDLVFGMFAGPLIYGRTFFHTDSPIRSKAVRRAALLEYAGIIIFWTTAAALFTMYNVWGDFVRVWFVPHWLAGVLQTGRKLTEHLGMASYDPLKGTRTVLGSNSFTRLCTWMNFDIFVHGPHHRHPRIAHHLLTQKMNEYRLLSNNDFPVFRTYLSATAAMVPFLFRNPGVGMNAGAARPDIEKLTSVENFVGDVSTEVLADSDLHALSPG
ncbi:MAG: fatty acid desaturase [Planctomycetaceae bacterium]|nr:fatty acid desaturase [Planctomycetaceae bacterium]